MKTMSKNKDLISRKQIHEFINEHREKIEKYGLMYGGNLNGVEVIWHTLDLISQFIDEKTSNHDLSRKAYANIASKKQCGSWTLSSKITHDMGSNPTAVTELIRCLKEVNELRDTLEKENSNE